MLDDGVADLGVLLHKVAQQALVAELFREHMLFHEARIGGHQRLQQLMRHRPVELFRREVLSYSDTVLGVGNMPPTASAQGVFHLVGRQHQEVDLPIGRDQELLAPLRECLLRVLIGDHRTVPS